MSDRIVVIGNPSSLFVQTPVRAWRRLGVDAVILTGRWDGDVVDGDLPVLSAEALAPASAHAAGDALVPLLTSVDTMVNTLQRPRVDQALRTWGPEAALPSLAPPVRDGILIGAALHRLEPAAVLGHEVFAYGLATRMAPGPRRSLFVWGGDVLHAAETSDAAFALVHSALHAANSVMTCADTMRHALHLRYALPLQRLALVSYGVDRRQFRRRTASEAASLRALFGIPAAAKVVMNVRRFMPHWGAETATAVLLALLERRADVHAVVLEGADQSVPLQRLLDAATERGVRGRLTAVRGHAPLSLVAELMGISDVALSLVDSLEPFSLSVLQAAAAGSTVVVADQETYREECRRGFAAALVPPRDIGATIEAVVAALDCPIALAATAASNGVFTAAHYDHEAAMLRQLRIVAGNAFVGRVTGRPAEDTARAQPATPV